MFDAPILIVTSNKIASKLRKGMNWIDGTNWIEETLWFVASGAPLIASVECDENNFWKDFLMGRDRWGISATVTEHHSMSCGVLFLSASCSTLHCLSIYTRRRSRCTATAVVVVLPWVPMTAIGSASDGGRDIVVVAVFTGRNSESRWLCFRRRVRRNGEIK